MDCKVLSGGLEYRYFAISSFLADLCSCGSRGGMAPLSLLKLVIKKMAAIGSPLYFMFLAPAPLTIPGSDAAELSLLRY